MIFSRWLWALFVSFSLAASEESPPYPIAQLYPNKLKNRNFANADGSRFGLEKTSPLLDVGAVFSNSKMLPSAKAKTDSSTCLGIEAMFPKSNTPLRIKNLWPTGYFVQLAIEPAIPQNFVLKSKPQDPYPACFAWGPKETLDTFNFEDTTLLPSSILCFKDVIQSDPKFFVHQTKPKTAHR